jgi:hypothetical protein
MALPIWSAQPFMSFFIIMSSAICISFMAISFFSPDAMPITSVFIFDIEASVHSIILFDAILSDIMASSAAKADEAKSQRKGGGSKMNQF